MEPPAASMAALAPFVTATPCTLTALSILPARMIFARFTEPARSPAAFGHEIHRIALDLAQVAQAHFDRALDGDGGKPRFGMRRCSGIWPPSKPTLW